MRRSYGTVLGLAMGIAVLTFNSLAWGQSAIEKPQEGAKAPGASTPNKESNDDDHARVEGIIFNQPAPAAAPAKKPPVDVEKLLDSTRIKVEFFETPLKDVCGYFSEILNVDVLLDKQGLEALGVMEDSPVSIQIAKSEVSVRTVLELVLRQLSPQAVAMPKDGLLVITSEANSYVTISYDLAELFGVDPRDPRARIDLVESTALLQLLKSKISPESWIEVGGQGSIDLFRTSLIVKNSPKVQREIRDVLQLLQPPPQAAEPQRKPGPPMHSRRPMHEMDPNVDVPAKPVEPVKPAPEEPDPEVKPAPPTNKLTPDRIRQSVLSLIKAADTNKDGTLQKEEWSKRKDFYEGADLDDDGELTMDEIITHVDKLLAEPPLKPLKPAVPSALPPPLPPPPAAPATPPAESP